MSVAVPHITFSRAPYPIPTLEASRYRVRVDGALIGHVARMWAGAWVHSESPAGAWGYATRHKAAEALVIARTENATDAN